MVFLSAAARLPTAGPAGTSTAWRFTLDAGHVCFDGHFDGDPVLPGVAHVAVALEACASLGADLPALAGVDDLRFLQPIVPGAVCEVTVRADSPTTAKFDLRCQGQASSRGRLRFSAPWFAVS